MNKQKILIIEDEQNIRESIAEMLELYDYEVSTAANGALGVAAVLSKKPDLIVCDVMMPEMDGYEVIHTLRQSKKTSAIPFLFLTAKSDPDDLRKGMDLGADDYLTKPFEMKALLSAVETRLQRSKEYQATLSDKLDEIKHQLTEFHSSHELNTPMHGILGSTDILLENFDVFSKDEIGEMLQLIATSARRIVRSIQNNTLFSKLKLFEDQPFELESIYKGKCRSPKRVIRFSAIQTAHQNHRDNDLHFDIEKCDCILNIKKENLSKVIDELIDNASRFSSAGSEILVSTKKNNGKFEISIQDHGLGFTQDELSSIGPYTQFQREAMDFNGYGLGLALSKSLVEFSGGSFDIESNAGEGTLIKMSIPILEEIEE